jgi:hypothetical protein
VIAATASRHETPPPQAAASRATFAIRRPRDGHRVVAPAMAASLFRFASVASGPRFSHDPVNLAPDYDG